MSDKKAPELKVKFIKKKGGHAAAHGGAWKVAYADLVTAMMAFFLLMWLLGSTSKATKEGIAGYMKEGASFFNTERGQSILAEFGKGILPGSRGLSTEGGDNEKEKDETEEAREAERKALEMLKKAIENAFDTDKLLVQFKDQISIDFTEEGMRIQIKDKEEQALFDSGSDRLKPYATSIIQAVSKELAKMKNHIVIGGHTDAIPYQGTGYTNWDLSTARANSALRAIFSSDFPQAQVKRVTGYAETLPMENLDSKDPQNRRISIIVLSSFYEDSEAKLNRSVGARPTPPSTQ